MSDKFFNWLNEIERLVKDGQNVLVLSKIDSMRRELARYGNMLVRELSISHRGINSLSYRGIETIGQLVRLRKQDLFCIPNFGQRSFEELVRELNRMKIPHSFVE